MVWMGGWQCFVWERMLSDVVWEAGSDVVWEAGSALYGALAGSALSGRTAVICMGGWVAVGCMGERQWFVWEDGSAHQ